MERLNHIVPKFLEEIPADGLEHGTLYVSEEYGILIHLCACGCGGKTVTPFKGREPVGDFYWGYQRDGEFVTLHGSIGNWQLPCQSHYLIVRNQIQWL